MWTHLKRLCHDAKGGPAIELGIIFPFFSTLVLGVAEYGMVMFQLMNVNHAAQVGAQYAMLNGYNATSIQAAVNAATGIATANVSVSESCGCATGTAITATSCGPPLPTCANGQPAGAYVTVTVTQAYSPVAPGISSPLTAATVVRVQ